VSNKTLVLHYPTVLSPILSSHIQLCALPYAVLVYQRQSKMNAGLVACIFLLPFNSSNFLTQAASHSRAFKFSNIGQLPTAHVPPIISQVKSSGGIPILLANPWLTYLFRRLEGRTGILFMLALSLCRFKLHPTQISVSCPFVQHEYLRSFR
jgi:hypothetical protein